MAQSLVTFRFWAFSKCHHKRNYQPPVHANNPVNICQRYHQAITIDPFANNLCLLTLRSEYHNQTKLTNEQKDFKRLKTLSKAPCNWYWHFSPSAPLPFVRYRSARFTAADVCSRTKGLLITAQGSCWRTRTKEKHHDSHGICQKNAKSRVEFEKHPMHISRQNSKPKVSPSRKTSQASLWRTCKGIVPPWQQSALAAIASLPRNDMTHITNDSWWPATNSMNCKNGWSEDIEQHQAPCPTSIEVLTLSIACQPNKKPSNNHHGIVNPVNQPAWKLSRRVREAGLIQRDWPGRSETSPASDWLRGKTPEKGRFGRPHLRCEAHSRSTLRQDFTRFHKDAGKQNELNEKCQKKNIEKEVEGWLRCLRFADLGWRQ